VNQPIAIGIVLRRGCVLVGLRAREPWAGCAEFPGGKLLPGETVEAAVQREVLEECGIAVRVDGLHERTRWDAGSRRLEIHFLLCRLADERDADRVRAPFRWIPVGELDALRFPPANSAALERLRTSAG
jgi:mutator protein MutT